MFPAAGATAEDRIGSGSVTVSDGQIYDNVYGDRSEGGDAASSGSRVSVIGGTVHREVYGGFAGTANGAASARGGSVNISGGLLDGDFGNNIYGGYAQSSNGNAVAEANSVVLDGTASLNVEKYIYGGYAQGNGSAASRVATRYNEISLGNGTVENIYGGYANDGPEFNGVLLAVENSVLVTGGTVTNVVYGGKADSDSRQHGLLQSRQKPWWRVTGRTRWKSFMAERRIPISTPPRTAILWKSAAAGFTFP